MNFPDRINTRLIRAVDHKLRQRIINLIEKNGELNVTAIYLALDIPQPVASQNLSVLHHSGVLRREVRGKNRYYSLEPNIDKKIYSIIRTLNNTQQTAV